MNKFDAVGSSARNRTGMLSSSSRTTLNLVATRNGQSSRGCLRRLWRVASMSLYFGNLIDFVAQSSTW